MPRGWGTPVSSSKHQHSHLEPHSHQAGWESCSQHQHPTRPQRPLTAAAHHPALPEAAFVPDLPKRRQKEDTRALTAQQKRILSHFCLSGAHPSHKTRHPDEDCQKKKKREDVVASIDQRKVSKAKHPIFQLCISNIKYLHLPQ